MKGWVLHREGEPRDVLTFEEVANPVVRPGHLVVEVEVAGVIFPDLLLTRGQYQMHLPPGAILGGELVGRVTAAAEDTAIPVGTRVMATTRPPNGSFAEQCLVLEKDAHPVPEDIPGAVAVSLPTNYVTAYLALHTRAHVQPGEVVLVHGGAGGVGTATIQIASAALGRVIATDLGPDRAALCRQAGAQRVVDMTEESLLDAVEEFSEGHGADVVIDVVGGDAFHDSRRCIAFEGRIVVVGFMSGHIPELKVNQLILRNFAVLGVNAMTYLWEHPDLHRAARQRVVELCASGALAPVIHAEYQPDELWDVLDQLDQRLIQGKAVIRFAGGPA